MDNEMKDLLQAGAAAAAILTCIGGAILFGCKAIRRLLSKRSSGRGGSHYDGPEVKATQIQRATKGAVSIQAGRDVNMVGGNDSNHLRGPHEGQ